MLAFSNDYYGLIFRATQSVELFCAYGVIPAMSISIIINLKVDLILIFSFILSLLYFKGATALLVLFIISLEMFIFSLWGLTPIVCNTKQ